MKSKKIFFNIAVHVGIIALILHVHIMTSCLTYNDPIMLIFFYIFSALGIVIHPTLFNNKGAETFLWYLLCFTSFVIPYVHIFLFHYGLLGFIAVICTMLLMNLLVSHNASAKYFPNTEHINLMVRRNVKFICYIGGLSEACFLLYSQFAVISEEIAFFYGIIELSIIILWCIYNIVYLYSKNVIFFITFIILFLSLLITYYENSSYHIEVNNWFIAVLQFIFIAFLILFVIIQNNQRIKLSKDKWLIVTIIVSLIMLSGINLYLYVVGFFPVKFIALQIASYAIATFLLIRNSSKKCKQNLNMEALIAGGLYAVFFIFNIVSTKIETGPGTEVIRHIQWSRMFVIFAFIVVVLSKLRFKKYNSIISALCVFFGGIALNIGIVYNQDLANYATWLPQILHKHLIISVCYGVAHFIINMLLQRRENSKESENVPNDSICPTAKNIANFAKQN